MTAQVIANEDAVHFPKEDYLVTTKLDRNSFKAKQDLKSQFHKQVYLKFNKFKRLRNGFACLLVLYSAPLALLDKTFTTYFEK